VIKKKKKKEKKKRKKKKKKKKKERKKGYTSMVFYRGVLLRLKVRSEVIY
jgi:hypothetical protein